MSRIESGETIGRYRVVGPIGAGGMGEVFLAEDPELRRRVAIKFLPADADATALQRFEQEALAASALNHPNILVLHEVGAHEGRRYLVTEYVEGTTLRALLKEGPLDSERALRVAAQIGRALDAAHRAGVIHRDVKPENVIVRPDGWVKLVDFGLAKLRARSESTEAATMTELKTEPGRVLGTVRYMSPEQARGLTVDARSDQFSLAVVLYEMLTGRVPFDGPTRSDVLAAILTREPEAPGPLPPGVATILDRALQKRPEARFDDVSELAEALESLLSSSSSVAARARSPWRRWTSAAIVAAALLFLFWQIGSGPTAPPPARAFDSPHIVNLPLSSTRDAAIDPQGRMIAYVARDRSLRSLRLHQIETGGEVELLPAAEESLMRPLFGPDGQYVYVLRGHGFGRGDLIRVPALGGVPTVVAEDVRGRPAFSPDGSRLAFVRFDDAARRLVEFDTTSGEERTLVERRVPVTISRDGLAWSPSGRHLTFVQVEVGRPGHAREDRLHQLRLYDFESGADEAVDASGWGALDDVAWLPDGDSLIFSGANLSTGYRFQLFRFDFADATLQRLTRDVDNYFGVSIDVDGERLVTSRLGREATVFAGTLDEHRTGRARELGPGGTLGQAWLDDRYVLFEQDYRIWRGDTEGNRTLLTPNAATFRGLNRCGALGVVMESWGSESGSQELLLIDGDGTTSTIFAPTDGMWPSFADCSPSGGEVVFESGAAGRNRLYRVAIEGGPASELTDFACEAPHYSPDGSRIVCFRQLSDDRPALAIVDAVDGEELRTIPLGEWIETLDWSATHGIVFAVSDNRGSRLYAQPEDGGEATLLLEVGDYIFTVADSPAGQLSLSRGTWRETTLLLKN